MINFLTILSWFIAIPSTLVFIIKIIYGFAEQKNYGGPGWFIISAICWAWIISHW